MKNTQVNFKILFLVLVSSLAFTNCSSDDDSIQTNQAPNNFNVIDVANDADLQLQLSWETASDPEGDVVSYQVFLDTQNPPQMAIANNLNVTSFNTQTDLQAETTY